MLLDKHGRKVNYLRLAVTDRCNLRCFYCMPEEGINWLGRKELMTYEEMLHISAVLLKMGVEKIRITGGEPFVRKDFMSFLTSLSKLQGLQELTMTTNGVLTAPFVPALKKIGVRSINLSLDTLDRNRFFAITRRDELPRVLETMEALLQHGIAVKLNAVVMEGKNTEDILPLVELTRDLPISVRFIEEMPFNGEGNHYANLTWDHFRILDAIREKFPEIKKVPDPPFSTSYNYQIPGHKGNVGVIAAYTRSFCGTCNRIRLTPQGALQTCLYGDSVLNVRDLMRSGLDEEGLGAAVAKAVWEKEKDGWEAEKKQSVQSRLNASMATIGG
ncbi:cyclic pyranopterin monophosphate synthase subunit MoaA [Pontibacter ummariensis]|uniref:GTP 3',8-cyclase n=1 Tax=Pontibacter ummariensis TaxID=1610492 RepID=A0A239I444_9BACT|nr:GTP 3',8-cyclase MoaA [Pontibacter ummariensis]PRY10215.1 cyclic pyranopterin monophosphate synthase subunit MoaA [Pontibacter ummariensis]SNS88251.1 cyclic pyranopterin monophosphate synthase subunit MoaA [Pontibacter ummariensis]